MKRTAMVYLLSILTTAAVLAADEMSPIAIRLEGGNLAGQNLNPRAPRITVPPGSSINGSVNLRVRNDLPPAAIAPLAATTTWGIPQSSLWQVDPWVTVGMTFHTAEVSVQAPAAPGTYFIVFALAGTYNVDQIMSGTHPAWTADWVNGNKVALLPSKVFRQTMVGGWILFEGYSPEGPKPGQMAMTAFEVVVR